MSQDPFAPSPAELQRLVNRLVGLVENSLILNSTLDPDQLLQTILETAANLLDCQAASILLFHESSGELRFAASTGSDTKMLANIAVPLDKSIAGRIFTENKPLLIHDVSQDPRHFPAVGQQVGMQIQSLLGVPMRIRDKTTGVLEALNKRQGQFTQEDIHILSVIANQAAVAIHNARLVQALQQAYQELSRVDQVKSNFLALASHELRTPLSIILGYASFLKDEAKGELSGHADQVLTSAMKMRSVLEAMSNMNQMRIGAMDLRPVRTSLQRILQLAYEEVNPLAAAKNQVINMFTPDQTIWIQADPEKLKLVFTNILNNAIQFSAPNGQVVVGVAEREGTVLVGIQDNGIGIAPEDLERIFDEFYQAEHHLTRRYGGLGLGLTIARGLVELHRGKIWAESAGLGQGAFLKVELPVVA